MALYLQTDIQNKSNEKITCNINFNDVWVCVYKSANDQKKTNEIGF